MKKLALSITEFAIPSPLVGSIETYSGYGGLPDVGTQLHLEIQEERLREFPGFVPEKWISHEFGYDKYQITVGGRMDGFCEEPELWIEEIKTAYDVEKLHAKLVADTDHPYRRQLLTYGYLYWMQTRRKANLRFCLVNSRNHSQEFMDLPLDIEEYEAWLDRRLKDVVDREKMFEAARKRRKKNADITFPFEQQRPGQRELIDTIADHLKKESRMLIQAPTGLGKTMGVVLPTLQNSLLRGQKTIYLTAKNSQHSVAEDAIERIQDSGTSIRALSLLAKRKMCFKEEVMCDPAYCEFAKDHYTKLDQHKVAEQLLKKRNLNERSLKAMAEKYEVCPFELQMESAAFADVVIGDYNYIFSPNNVRERLGKNGLGKTTSLPNLVIDEAHNLPARALSYFSVELNLREIEQIILKIENPSSDIVGGVQKLSSEAREFFDRIAEASGGRSPSVITLTAGDAKPLRETVQKLLTSYLESDEPLQRDDPIVHIYNLIVQFVDILENYRDEFIIIYESMGGKPLVKIVCCDAAWWLKDVYKDFSSVVAFSATLKPFEYYQALLGLNTKDTVCAEFETPFPKENRKILVIPQVSTKLRDRAANVVKIKAAIGKIVSIRPGNYFVFFPSFDFLEKVSAQLEVPGFEIILQKRNMEKFEVEGVIRHLRDQVRPTIVMAVQGGVFSEGVDYPGESIIGAIIVGPALPAFNFEREQIREYYDKKFGAGFDYAYTFPAMARTIQSAGRVIRSSTDRGLIVLMDKRFLEDKFVGTMPKDWVEGHPQELASQRILDDLHAFWSDDGPS